MNRGFFFLSFHRTLTHKRQKQNPMIILHCSLLFICSVFTYHIFNAPQFTFFIFEHTLYVPSPLVIGGTLNIEYIMLRMLENCSLLFFFLAHVWFSFHVKSGRYIVKKRESEEEKLTESNSQTHRFFGPWMHLTVS